MKLFQTRFAWAVYIIGAALVFLYVLFPSDLVKPYLADMMRQIHPNVTMKIGRFKLGFPPALRLHDVSVYHSGRAIADLENVKLSPHLLSLFMATTRISIKGNGYGGTFNGDVNITKKADDREIVVDADLAGIQVNQLEAIRELTAHKLSGVLNGTVTLTIQVPQQALTGDLILTDGKIELSPPLLSQRELTFDSIEAQLMFNGRSLMIEHCEMVGNQLDGEVAGSIQLSRQSSSNILDLKGNIRPRAELLARLGNQVPKLMENKNLQTQGVPFKIKGTIDSPTYTFY
ncbi:MAG: type II secretion system protein GspN [Desulfobacterales bacterium]|jgi:type II secretion system protein N